jgi:hypothetical protein
MSYIGNPPAEAYTNTVKDTFSGDGSTVAFTLSRPSLTNDVRVVVENVIQDPTVAYGVSGTTLTFTSAPPSGTNNIYVVHLGPAIQTAVPPSEISTNTTFAGNVTVQGAFTSQGIDDNANATAMTIDSSENVLVGKTSTSTTVEGVIIQQGGFTGITRSGGNPLSVLRRDSNGDIVQLYRDATQVGSIGTSVSDGIYIDGGSSATGLRFGNSGHIIPRRSNADSNGDVDFGVGTNRFRNLYLSGGVYLGGTVSANFLDDYEEGTWTPSVTGTSGGSMGLANSQGSYTKIGRVVTLNGYIDVSSAGTASGLANIANFPFTVGDTVGSTSLEANGTVSWFSFAASVNSVFINAVEGTNEARLLGNTSATQTSIVNLTPSNIGTANMRFSITYFTS